MWQPIETAPKDKAFWGSERGKNYSFVQMCWWNGKGYYMINEQTGGYDKAFPSFWYPLPDVEAPYVANEENSEEN